MPADTGRPLDIRNEPFKTLRPRVITLYQQLWPNIPSSRFLVDADRSANNRIIGIK
jgi:hypothetical protein